MNIHIHETINLQFSIRIRSYGIWTNDTYRTIGLDRQSTVQYREACIQHGGQGKIMELQELHRKASRTCTVHVEYSRVLRNSKMYTSDL